MLGGDFGKAVQNRIESVRLDFARLLDEMMIRLNRNTYGIAFEYSNLVNKSTATCALDMFDNPDFALSYLELKLAFHCDMKFSMSGQEVAFTCQTQCIGHRLEDIDSRTENIPLDQIVADIAHAVDKREHPIMSELLSKLCNLASPPHIDHQHREAVWWISYCLIQQEMGTSDRPTHNAPRRFEWEGHKMVIKDNFADMFYPVFDPLYSDIRDVQNLRLMAVYTIMRHIADFHSVGAEGTKFNELCRLILANPCSMFTIIEDDDGYVLKDTPEYLTLSNGRTREYVLYLTKEKELLKRTNASAAHIKRKELAYDLMK